MLRSNRDMIEDAVLAALDSGEFRGARLVWRKVQDARKAGRSQIRTMKAHQVMDILACMARAGKIRFHRANDKSVSFALR